MRKIVHEYEEYNAVLVRNKFGYWLRQNGENPGLLIKAISGMPTQEQAIAHAIKCLQRSYVSGILPT